MMAKQNITLVVFIMLRFINAIIVVAIIVTMTVVVIL